MEKTILVIGRSFHPDGKETAELIATSLTPYIQNEGYRVVFLALKDILFDINTGEVKIMDPSGVELKKYGAVLMTNWFSHASIRKDIAYSLGLYFKHNQVAFFNEEAAASRSTSKLSQMVVAAYANIPIARTIFSLSLQRTRNYASKVIKAPFILKDAQASRGAGNYLLQDFGQVLSHKAEHTEKTPFVIQECISSDGSDFRFFVTGNAMLVIKRSGADGSHLNNTSAGGSAELVPLEQFDQDVINYVQNMSHLLGRNVTGIDIMFDSKTNKPYFLEANPIPQIATGSFVHEKLTALADMLVLAAKEKL